METNHGETRQLLVEFSISYVIFLVENPFLRSILMIKDDEFDMVYNKLRAEMSKLTQELVAKYCREVNMPEETYVRKLYVVRALIYGAALMFDNGELEYNEENLEFVRKNIDRSLICLKKQRIRDIPYALFYAEKIIFGNHPSPISSTIMAVNPTANVITPACECSPCDISGINSSTTT